ncbi:MobF family relaxase [Teredinibacter turnerae]|uniref:MobF family relaxase n=1 Tax=Teredinibacter turnerae TaxID=2426 RepID=UPI000362A993|nr:MobF family relaxase [Teredinibacter turnerae]
MLRVYQSASSTQAKSYFAKELSQGDYYFGEQEIAGQWGGKAATLLGLSGEATQAEFNQLVDNIHPQTGEQLTAHTKANRRPGYDLTFNVPKSLSVLYEYSKDERLLEAFRASVHSTMQEIEEAMQVRVRKNGADENRTTGNLVYAAFEHYTARPVEGAAPDPQLHMHCFVQNASFDPVENQWKAVQLGDIKRDAPYYEALFHSHLTERLSAMGLAIEKDGKFWNIAGLEKESLTKFSSRTQEIEAAAAEKNITSPEAKDRLGAQLRSAKIEGLTREQLRHIWWDRLEDNERETLDRLSAFQPTGGDGGGRSANAKRYLAYALETHLERQSVVPLTRLKETMLREGFGETAIADVNAALAEHQELITIPLNGRMMASTKSVLHEEQDIIDFTRNGYGTCAKINEGYAVPKVVDQVAGVSFELSEEQKEAVTSILESHHRVMAVQGKAGVGKTTMMASLIHGMEQGSEGAVVLAPTADAAYDTLRTDGEHYGSAPMKDAQTLARFFTDKEAWEAHRGKTLIVDEAGLMSVGDMHNLFAIANRFDNRVVLVGDTGQHNSVVRGDAFRILQQEAGLETLQLEHIRRQKGAYRQAVRQVAFGNLEAGFNRLDELGAITEESDSDTRYKQLATSFVRHVNNDASVLTVAPTHAEGKRVTEAIREELKAQGALRGEAHQLSRYHNLQLTEAERGNVRSYQPGQMVRFQQNARGGIKRGTQFTVSRIEGEQVFVKSAHGQEQLLDKSLAKHYSLYEKRDIEINSGDRIRITEGGKSKDGRRINNGAIYQVKRVESNGDLLLENGRVLDASQGNFNHGYVTTSHASQGKTVQHVLIAQSTEFSGASSHEQFYVSVSRGKQSVEIYTDDKTLLREQVKSSHQRVSATELTKNQPDIDARKREDLQRMSVLASLAHRGGKFVQGWNPFKRAPDAANDSWRERMRQKTDRGRER